MGEIVEVHVDPLEVLRTRLSSKWRTYPVDVLPLTVAEMDFSLAPSVADALRAAVDRSDTGYGTSASGLQEALAGFALRRWGWTIDPGSVTGVTDVATGVVELFRVLSSPGDAVVCNTPVYHPFFDWVEDVGARVHGVPLVHDEAGWRLDLERLEAAFRTGPAVYLLCNPHNPVGRAHRPDELAEVVRLAHRYGVKIISDEIHGPIAYGETEFTPLLTIEGASEITACVFSASKAWNLAALRCAVIITADAGMAELVARIPRDVRWRTGHFGVIAAIAAFEHGEEWLDRALLTLDRRRAQLGALLAEQLPEVAWSPPEATYLAWLNCRALGLGEEPRDVFLEHGRVALESGPRFGPGGAGYVRLNFATSAEVLEEAVRRMVRARGRVRIRD